MKPGRTPRGWAAQRDYARSYRKKVNMTAFEWRIFLDKSNTRVKRRRLRLRRSGLNTNGQPYKHLTNRRRFSLEQV